MPTRRVVGATNLAVTVGSERSKVPPATASALRTSPGIVKYAFCNKNHQSEKCLGVLKLTRSEREEKIRDTCQRTVS